jgi:hypothetical protein
MRFDNLEIEVHVHQRTDRPVTSAALFVGCDARVNWLLGVVERKNEERSTGNESILTTSDPRQTRLHNEFIAQYSCILWLVC